MTKDATEFEWFASESGPEHYPMEIRDGVFFYKGQTNGLYIPNGATLYGGWGKKRSHHVTFPKLKPLPDRMEVYFYSYAESEFYHGKFDLPYDKILSMFRQGYEESPEKPYYSDIIVGVAPGGAVSVWLGGFRQTEIFFGQAEKVLLNPSEGFDLPLESKREADEYAHQILVDSLTPEELASLKKEGIPFGLWARYRKTYKWRVTYKNGLEPFKNEIYVHFLNGEYAPMPKNFSEDISNKPKPLPRFIGFAAPTAAGRNLVFEITFDDVEILQNFEKLGAKGEQVTIEIEPRAPQEATIIRIFNDKESIELKKATVK